MRAGLQVRAAIVVMERNTRHTERTYRFLQELGISQISVAASKSVGRGELRPDPDLRSLDTNGSAVSMHRGYRAGPGTSSVCVAYDGSVVPCIFNRSDRLGHLAERSLVQILEAPHVPQSESLGVCAQSIGDRLACVSCQLTACALRMALGGHG